MQNHKRPLILLLLLLLASTALAQWHTLYLEQFTNAARKVDTAAVMKELASNPYSEVYAGKGVYQFIDPGPLDLLRGENLRGDGPQHTVFVFQASAKAGVRMRQPYSGKVTGIKFEGQGAQYGLAVHRGPGPSAPANRFSVADCTFSHNYATGGAALVIQGCELTSIINTHFEMAGLGDAVAYTSEDYFGTGIQSSANWTCSGHVLHAVSFHCQQSAAIVCRGAVTDLEVTGASWASRPGTKPLFILEQDATREQVWGRTPRRIDFSGMRLEQPSSVGVTSVISLNGLNDKVEFRYPCPGGWLRPGEVTYRTKIK